MKPATMVILPMMMTVMTTAVECSDGVVGANEECDDGNTIDTDACTAQCTNAVWAMV